MNILCIGGSDPSGGAGIQGDVKTIFSLGANALTVITSITSQNTEKFVEAKPVSPKIISQQIESVMSDFKIDAIKISMVYDSATIKAVFGKLNKTKIPILLDPVIKSTTGGVLLQSKALTDYKKILVSVAQIITPNVFEAEKISGVKIKKESDLTKAAKIIHRLGAKNVIITGFESDADKITDYVLERSKNYKLTSKKLAGINRGSGGNFSSALAFCIAMKKNIRESIKFSKKFTLESIRNARKVGKGIKITNVPKIKTTQKSLQEGIDEFVKIKNISEIIPECQTNFVYAQSNPKTVNDVFGILGRIVKVGNSVVIAGDLQLGGSKHVASAVLEFSKKFPKIRSAINMKYDPKFIKKFRKKGLKIANYDRMREPTKIKSKEGSSISWGLKSAIKDWSRPPDIVYHLGDVGKEPMILIFGQNPKQVLQKLTKIFPL